MSSNVDSGLSDDLVQITPLFFDVRRVFIDSGLGCPGGCPYCYLTAYEYRNGLRVSSWSADELISLIVSNSSFQSGKYGSLISFSRYSDPFSPDLVEKTFEFLIALSRLGNPIQISSKFTLSDSQAARLAQLRYPRRLVLHPSLSTTSFWSNIEPGCPPPAVRLQNAAKLRAYGINVCPLIKPVLPGITDQDALQLAKLITDFEFREAVVGLAYFNKANLAAMTRQLKGAADQIVAKFEKSREHRLAWERSTRTTLLPDDDSINVVIEALRDAGVITVFKTSSCAISHYLQIPDGMETWVKFPELCVQCQDCPGFYEDLPSPLKETYPILTGRHDWGFREMNETVTSDIDAVTRHI